MDIEPTIEYAMDSCWEHRLRRYGFRDDLPPGTLSYAYDGWRFTVQPFHETGHVGIQLVSRIGDSLQGFAIVPPQKVYHICHRVWILLHDPQSTRHVCALTLSAANDMIQFDARP